MPFASVPESVQGPGHQAGAAGSVTSNIPATLPPASETPDSASTPSRMSPSTANATHDPDGSKSPGGDSSEVDMESLKAESLDIEGSSSGEAKGRGTKRKAPNDPGSRSPAPSRRKRRTRESSRGRGGGRGRHGSGRDRRDHDDTDESEEAKDSNFAMIGNLDDDALTALAQASDRSSKYNFYPDFGKNCDTCFCFCLLSLKICLQF